MGIFSQLNDFGITGVVFLSIEIVLTILLVLYSRQIKSRRDSEGIPDDFLLKYDKSQGVFYYPINALQRKYGYCELYDEGAAGLGIVIECEPVRFTWGGRNWLIEMWKGQYGLAAGGEIGVYSTADLISDAKSAMYLDTDTLLEMEITLKSNGEKVFTRRDTTWWITGFIPGMFVWPDQLSVQAKIKFPEKSMARAFADELYRMGYKSKEVYLRRETVMVLFTEPKSPQPQTRITFGKKAQKINQISAKTYKEASEGFENIEELLNSLKRFEPELYRYLTGIRSFKMPLSNNAWKKGGI